MNRCKQRPFFEQHKMIQISEYSHKTDVIGSKASILDAHRLNNSVDLIAIDFLRERASLFLSTLIIGKNMKLIIIALSLISLNAMALDMTAAKGMAKQAGAKAVKKGQEVYAACKSEHLEYCKAYTQLEPLKECLTKNKEKLSPGCKSAMGL